MSSVRDDNRLADSSSGKNGSPVPNGLIDNNLETISPHQDCQTLSPAATTFSIPNKVFERIEFKKWSIDRWYPILLEQSQKVSQQDWIEFCDTVDDLVGLRRRAYAAVFLSWAGALALLLYLLIKVQWFQELGTLSQLLSVMIILPLILPATIYKCQVTGTIRKKLEAFCTEYSNQHLDLELTLKSWSSQFQSWHIQLVVQNMENIDVQDVEFANHSMASRNRPMPPKMYCKLNDNDDILYVNGKYLRWRKIQHIRNRNRSTNRLGA